MKKDNLSLDKLSGFRGIVRMYSYETSVFFYFTSISFISIIFLLTNSVPSFAQKSKIQGLEVINIGSQRQLFVDNFLVEKLRGGAELRLHHPVIQEIALVHDENWEGSYSNYHSIFKDGNIYRMYYRGWSRGLEKETAHPMVWCYAESKDGIHWEKPNLGLFEFNGSKQNNIVLASREYEGFHFTLADNVTVFKDENPNVPADALYKALVDSRPGSDKSTWILYAFKSSDGIHWFPMSSKPILTDGSFDSQNTAFWDGKRKEYRIYWRFFDKNNARAIRTATSKDFIHWENEAKVTYTDTMEQQLYTNGVIPYYRAPQVYIGFPARYIDRGWSSSIADLPELNQRVTRGFLNPRYSTALTGSVFMTSRDGVIFKRWNDAFLRPGIERNGTWSYGQQYIGWSILETKSTLGGAPNELSLYANENLWTGAGSVLRRYTLRLDGFVSVNAPMEGGGFITRPFKFTGKQLSLNFSTSAYGTVKVEIQDLDGKPIPGFTLEDCSPIFGDSIDRTVTWNKRGYTSINLSALKGKSVRLYVEMYDADLYSFHFHN